MLFRSGPYLACVFTMSVLLERPLVELSRKNLTICILDDEADHVELISRRLEAAGFPVSGTTSAQEALQKVRSGSCRVVVADMKMPGMDGLAFLEKALQCDPGMYVMMMTGFYAVDSAIEAIKHGAYDYLCKPIDYTRLLKTLDDLTDSFTRGLQIRDLEVKLLDNLLFHGIVGRSPAMLEVFDLAKKIARHYTNALITGPTGSGKELVAHALHQMSPVSQERFAVCNCSALVDTLLESQLFGHVRGSFTGATETRPGLFEYANGGTVFLDEIGETSLQMQAKLLRVVKYGETYGKPFQGLTRRAHIVLLQHDWPGNVRELENVIASAAITANSDFIDVGDLPEHLQRSRRQSSSAATVWSPLPLDEVRSVHIQRVLEMCNGNRVRTAQVLGIGRTSLYRFLKRSDRPSKSVAARGAA